MPQINDDEVIYPIKLLYGVEFKNTAKSQLGKNSVYFKSHTYILIQVRNQISTNINLEIVRDLQEKNINVHQ